MGCHHSEGGLCIVCDAETDTCCGDDEYCEKCGNDFCYDCYKKCMVDYEFECPVCLHKIVTDEMVIKYFLEKYGLTRQSVVEIIQNEYKLKNPIKQPDNNSTSDSDNDPDSESGDDSSSDPDDDDDDSTTSELFNNAQPTNA
jgi:hypothetical protein